MVCNLRRRMSKNRWWFCAGHAWDCQAARQHGYLTTFCQAYEEPIWSDAWPQPDAQGEGLLNAVTAAIAHEESLSK